MDGARPDAMSDAQLNRELEAALGVEPSPEFHARVRTRIASEPLPVESGFSRILQRSVEPMWAVAIVGIVLAVVVPQWMRGGRAPAPGAAVNVAAVPIAGVPIAGVPIAGVASPQTGTQAGLQADLRVDLRVDGVQRPTRTIPRLSETEVAWGRTLPLQLSPVLFAEDDSKMFAMFVEAAGAGRVPEDAIQRSDESGEMEGLSIEPLAIAPLPSLARTIREGEEQWE